MASGDTDFGRVAEDLRRAATQFALLTTSATAFGAALNTFREFEKQLRLTNAIAQGTEAQFQAMEAASRQFSLVTTTSAVDAAAALQQLAQAGFSAEESLSAMNGVLLLSQATLTDVRVASDIVSSNIRAFGLEAGETTRVANLFSAAITGSLATMDKLAFALRQVGPVAEVANLSIEQTTALLGQLFNIGLRGEQAGTALRNIIVRLIRPLGEAGKLLEGAGIATRRTNGDLRDLADILRDIGNSDLTDADLARIFETEALAGAIVAIKSVTEVADDGTTAYERLLDEISGTDRALELAVENLETFDGALGLFRNTVNDFQKDIGEALAPAVLFVTDLLSDMAAEFRALDPETQKTILSFVGLAGAGVGLLAVVNALILLLKGPLLVSIVAATKAFATYLAGLILVSAQSGILGAAIAALTGGLGLLVRGITATTAALLALGLNPVVLGIAALTVGVAGATAGFIALSNRAEEAADVIGGLSFDERFELGRVDGQELADSIIPQEGLDELDRRILLLGNKLDLAQTLFATDPLELAKVSRNSETQALALVERIEGRLQQFEEADPVFTELRERIKQAQAAAEGIEGEQNTFTRTLEKVLVGAGGGGFVVEEQDIISGLLGQLSAQRQGEFEAFNQRATQVEDDLAQARSILEQSTSSEENAYKTFITAFSLGQLELREELALFAVEARRSLDENPGVEDILAETLLEGNFEDEQRAFLTRLAVETGNTALLQSLVAFFNTQKNAELSQIPIALEALRSANSEIVAAARTQVLETELGKAEDVADAVRIATELANAEFEGALSDAADDIGDTYAETLGQFISGGNEAIIAVLDQFKEDNVASRLGLEELPIFTELVSGKAIVDAINGQINSSSSPEEIQAIADAEFEKYSELMVELLEAVKASSNIPEENLIAIFNAFKSSKEAIDAAAIAGLSDNVDFVASAREDTTKRIERASRGGRRSRGGGGGGKSAEDIAKEALRDARKIEDAFLDAEEAARDAREALLNASQGLGIDLRASELVEIDVEGIAADFDKQIRDLERKLEDLELDFGGSPEQLAALRSQYTETIALLEQTKLAEIAAANSFENQMKRRSDAIDLFIRDLENLAFESTNTFDKVAAGIGIAFAQYQEDLVTLVGITSDAVTGFLDAVTTGIGDFIFDNENAFEAFKASMLDISREVFEGFTRGLIQQGISSLTGGAGSIFGNALQPGPGGDQGVPSVGTGGLLGGLFGGLFGGGDQAAPGVPGGQNTAQIDVAVSAVAQSLQQGAQQITAAFSSIAPQVQVGGARVGAGLNSAGTQIQANGQTAAVGVQGAGTALAGSIRGAAAQVSAAPTGGVPLPGGGGLSFGSLFTAGLGLLGFAEGGRVRGPGTGTSDSILAAVSNDEFITRAAVTREFLPLLEAMNAGKGKEDVASIALRLAGGGKDFARMFEGIVPAFAEGGLVGGVNSPAISEPRIISVQGASPSRRVSGGSSTTNITLAPVYNIRGNDPGGTLRKSANQHAKELGAMLESSKRNT